ncbi:MAG TPA: dTDP-4-amino-4,6-dideoxygalactose transaminase [Ignavibacteria bacterium]|nr:dTDP-4-amino-4,6-dideoxygalactose transaminase [Ignavibacteria bacterium]HQY51113.1 dTDP-4-amino-4,6-dideoxygalactose transaminase [Ignavibacteria bacterium]HRA98965.1 dTDP-4-amino-4,6-dideoxygalactose transaminase [Ignavibacteria bacterium]
MDKERRHIGFNKPYLTGKETEYILDSVRSRKISGDGLFTKKCHEYFENRFGFKKVLLTTSCTDALEMAAILIDTKEGDEIIVPAYTFVSSANAFVLRGAKIKFCDSEAETPNIDVKEIKKLITSKTKAVIVVHYAGIAVDMDPLIELSDKHNFFIIEDAAHSIDSYYKGKPLGSIGHLAAFSFHETKNVVCGEGGMLVINDERFFERSEIIREKGTNRSAFFRGEVDKYGWVDIGSSFLPSDILAAFLYAQLENLDDIQKKRKYIWDYYFQKLMPLKEKGFFKYSIIPEYATNNAHMFFIECRDIEERSRLISYLKEKGIYAVFHYLSLNESPYYKEKCDQIKMENSDRYTDCLLRLPMYYELSDEDLEYVTYYISKFFEEK